MDNLANLALDFERKRQFNKAQAVYEYMAQHNSQYKDLGNRLNRVKQLSETVMLGGGANRTTNTLVLDDAQIQKPMLGRYQVEKTLGKGAMGVVYLGRDPKIGRVVAIKTMALAQELANKGVTVNTVSPGYIGTDMVNAIRPDVLEKIVATVPVKRLGKPSEIASIIAWLASDEGGYATGADFSVNGGLHMG